MLFVRERDHFLVGPELATSPHPSPNNHPTHTHDADYFDGTRLCFAHQAASWSSSWSSSLSFDLAYLPLTFTDCTQACLLHRTNTRAIERRNLIELLRKADQFRFVGGFFFFFCWRCWALTSFFCNWLSGDLYVVCAQVLGIWISTKDRRGDPPAVAAAAAAASSRWSSSTYILPTSRIRSQFQPSAQSELHTRANRGATTSASRHLQSGHWRTFFLGFSSARFVCGHLVFLDNAGSSQASARHLVRDCRRISAGGWRRSIGRCMHMDAIKQIMYRRA